MGVKGRRTYTESFKADAIRMVTQGGKSVRQVARDLDLDSGSLHTWVRQQQKRSGDVAQAASTGPLEDEVRRLRKELARVTEERDILKKSDGVLRERKQVWYAFIRETRNTGRSFECATYWTFREPATMRGAAGRQAGESWFIASC
ncbi:hypothetical protein WPS_04270 [Vulcanimicrobium alpinum]|uniref:HTH psq-type domain-containing protein n=1 Tax=Vulcanimicrobium alpinum TaxID=3016050 RepID=A0AAN1XVF3_UNVUL|nr:transposase [Vulcanimicrobium alpinum]BDE05151.1 hypothetical protein WPS_04270 [Vulcanimicrobium alpinum]